MEQQRRKGLGITHPPAGGNGEEGDHKLYRWGWGGGVGGAVCLMTQCRRTCLWALLALLPAEATNHACASLRAPSPLSPRSFADLFRAIRVEDFSSYISKVGWAGWAAQHGFGRLAGCARVWWDSKQAAAGAGRWSAEWIAAAPGVFSGVDHHGTATPAALQLTTPRELMLFMTGERLQLMMWRQMDGKPAPPGCGAVLRKPEPSISCVVAAL